METSASITGQNKLPWIKIKLKLSLIPTTSLPYLDNISVVELILKCYDLPHEPEGTQLEECVPGLDQDQDPSQQVLVEDIVLDVIGMMLHEEAEQLQNETQDLNSAAV